MPRPHLLSMTHRVVSYPQIPRILQTGKGSASEQLGTTAEVWYFRRPYSWAAATG